MSERVARWATAAAVTLWLAGWIPSIVYSWRVAGGPQFYAVWIILAPLAIFGTAGFTWVVYCFYRAVLPPSRHERCLQRIERLEIELGYAPSFGAAERWLQGIQQSQEKYRQSVS